MRTPRAAAVWSTALLLLLGSVTAPDPTRAEDEAVPAAAEEEEELEGEAKRLHDKAVKRLLRYLATEKNRTLVKGKIEELGAQGTRAARDALMAFVVGNKNQEYVHHAFQALTTIGGVRVIDFLCGKHGLRSRNFLVAHSAAETLADLPDERTIEPLLEVLQGKRTKIKVVSACAVALAKTAGHDPRVVEVLFDLSHHRKDTIRAYVIESLGHLGSDAAVARLTDALRHDKNARVREYAASGLGRTGRPEVLPVLREALAEDTSHSVRTACMDAIRSLS